MLSSRGSVHRTDLADGVLLMHFYTLKTQVNCSFDVDVVVSFLVPICNLSKKTPLKLDSFSVPIIKCKFSFGSELWATTPTFSFIVGWIINIQNGIMSETLL